MADPKDPLGVAEAQRKTLGQIQEIYRIINAKQGDLTKAAAEFDAELKKVATTMGLLSERNETLVKTEKLIDKIYKSRTKKIGDINELLGVNKKLRDQELKNEQEKLVEMENQLKVAAQRSTQIRDQIKSRDELLDKFEKENKATLEQILLDRRRNKIGAGAARIKYEEQEKLYEKQKEYLGGLEDEQKANSKIIFALPKRLKAQAQSVDEQEKYNSGIEKSVGFFDKMLEQTGVFSEKWKEGPLGGIMDFQESGKDINDLFEELRLKAGKINLKNIGVNALLMIGEQTLKLMIQFDKLTGDFRKSTGIISKGFGGMEQSVMNVHKANLRMGVSMEEAFGATSALVGNMAAFTGMTKDSQQQVLQATVILQEFGVSASDTASIFKQ